MNDHKLASNAEPDPIPSVDEKNGGIETSISESEFRAGSQHGNHHLQEQAINAQTQERETRSRSTLILAISLSVSLLANVLMVYGFAVTPKEVPIALTAEGAKQICRIPTLDKPYVGTPTVQAFAAEAMLELGSFDSENWKRQVNNNAAKYLTDEFRNQYIRAFETSDILDLVKKNGAIATFQPAGRYQVLSAGQGKSGVYQWVVQVPVDVYIKSGVKQQPKLAYVAELRIKQIPPNPSNYRGIAVDSISLAARAE